uniref:EF-hand calcium-binding domain-containing protein 14-like isoform X2 n=1 Tax=Saccoglossus kowalevskii TaxID=10224 RepID=A0ABM0MDR9_SACKO|nr:PREDICTED: EF-hand calcium-binding domain-containing protein 14-like isoform X2 [Saccoglossus kowalevskii]
MKKRKELDALVGNGKLVKKKKRSDTGHELLRMHDSSSEIEEFCARKTVIRKPSRTRICATCFPICAFILVVACIAVCSGLVWMNLDLKRDVDQLRHRLQKVEASNGDNSGTMSALGSSLDKLNEDLDTFKNEDKDKINKLHSDVNDILSQIDYLNKTAKQLTDSVDSAKELLAVPSAVLTLQKSVATQGSDINGVQEHVTGLQSAQRQTEDDVDKIKSDVQALTSRLDSLELSSISNSNVESNNVQKPTPHPPTTLAKIIQATTLAPPPPAVVVTEAANAQQEVNMEVDEKEHISDGNDAEKLVSQQKIERVEDDLEDMNVTLNNLTDEYNELLNRIVTLENPPTSQSNDTDLDIQQMYDDLHALMDRLSNNNATSSPSSDDSELTSDTLLTIEDTVHNMTVIVNDLKTRVDELNPNDLNNNLLNVNTTLGMQQILQNAADKMKEENGVVISQLQTNMNTVWTQMTTQTNTITDMQEDIAKIKITIQQLEESPAAAHESENVNTEQAADQELPEEEFEQPGAEAGLGQPVETGLEQPATEAGLEQPAPEAGLEQPAPETGLEQPASEAGLEQPASEAGLEQPASEAGLEQPASEAGLEQPVETGLEQPASEAGLEQPAPEAGMQQPGPEDLEETAPEAGLEQPVPGEEAQETLPTSASPHLQTISLPGISTTEMMINQFYSWDKDSDGFVSYLDLSEFFGAFMPSEQILNQFDFDHNGKFDKDELAIALGFLEVPQAPVPDNNDQESRDLPNPSGNQSGPGESTDKPGTCPVVASEVIGTCSEMCTSDASCPGILKCCSNGCGHGCTNPILNAGQPSQ